MVRNEKIARSNSGRPCLTRGIYGLTEPEYEEARPVPSRHICWRKEYFTTSFSGEDFFHPRLVRILQDHYPEQQAKVEYKCTKWTHPKYESHWSTEAHITRWNEFTGSRVVESIHSSLSDRFSKHASISDAAHQALLAYHGKHYEERKNDKQKYLPRRPPGTLQCVMADPYLEQNEQLKEMALTIQVMHQKLEDSQLELAEVRQHYEEALDEIDEWRSRGGLPKINEVEDIPRLTPRKRCYPGCRCSHTVFKK